MIYFGICVGDENRYRAIAEPSIAAACPGAVTMCLTGQRSIHAAYAQLLEAARTAGDAEALVLMHEDVVLADADVAAKLRRTFGEDERIAIVGVVGGRRPRSLRWHGQTPSFGSVAESRFDISFLPAPADVDVLDGLFLALSPWAIEHLDFDEVTYGGFHAYDADICLQARERGGRVVVRDIELFHATKGGLGDARAFRQCDRIWRDKWHGSRFVDARMRTWDTKPGLRKVADLASLGRR